MTFQQIYTAIIADAPQLAAKNTHAIHEWLATYDLEKDILPAIAAAAKKGVKAVRQFSFFTGWIQKEQENRLKKEASRPQALPPEQGEARRAQWIELRLTKFTHIHVSQADQEWLAAYRKENPATVSQP